ncbi:hypothetical protein A9G05_08295 [Pseudomonas sp. ENNP23]|nr:hypothetical protein A9G05_08295 [Pseudomonas sp. ENNP23]
MAAWQSSTSAGMCFELVPVQQCQGLLRRCAQRRPLRVLEVVAFQVDVGLVDQGLAGGHQRLQVLMRPGQKVRRDAVDAGVEVLEVIGPEVAVGAAADVRLLPIGVPGEELQHRPQFVQQDEPAILLLAVPAPDQ